MPEPEVSFQQALADMADLRNKWSKFIDDQLAVDFGTADYVTADPPGQPEPGWYPITYPSGVIVWKRSTAKIVMDANLLNFERRVLTSGSTHMLTAADAGKTLLLAGTTGTSNITCQLPNAPPGWGVNIIQEGTGGPRITFTIANNGSGQAGFLRHRQGAFRSAGENALVTAICRGRDSSFRSTIVLGGDLTI